MLPVPLLEISPGDSQVSTLNITYLPKRVNLRGLRGAVPLQKAASPHSRFPPRLIKLAITGGFRGQSPLAKYKIINGRFAVDGWVFNDQKLFLVAR